MHATTVVGAADVIGGAGGCGHVRAPRRAPTEPPPAASAHIQWVRAFGGAWRRPEAGLPARARRPAHALQFAVYEAIKDVLGGNVQGHSAFISGFAGAVATGLNDAVMTPVDVIKQRLQVVFVLNPG